MSESISDRSSGSDPGPEKPQLKVYNSLTKSIVPFKPISGNVVKWYTCGPTVYDSAHLGHARAYVTFDIIRRILSDYFEYDVQYVMNITDVDDKIILRARRNYLFDEYEKSVNDDAEKVIADANEAFDFAIADAEKKVASLDEKLKTIKSRYLSDTKEQLQQSKLKRDNLLKERENFGQLADAVLDYAANVAGLSVSREAVAEFEDNNTPIDDSKNAAPLADVERVVRYKRALRDALAAAQGVIAAKLDDEKGALCTDQSIFQKHAKFYEEEFLKDMADLGVREVDTLTRVTEYIPHIIAFVEKIIANGYAYESGGSVYFDTIAFMKATGKDGLCHHYAKLKPSAVGNLDLASEGEGALGSSGDKKHPNDFALWKLSRPGEPRWESPWGLGRPGWHIECSAMATDVLGDHFDIHTGGDDLKFPHHDNEIAQSEAHSDTDKWVNYFFHAGHLSIAGLKMSKSLKNFVTIRECIDFNPAREIRLLFLSQSWDGTMQYSDDSLQQAMKWDKTLRHFFMNAAYAIKPNPNSNSDDLPLSESEDGQLRALLDDVKANVHAALCNNLNYPQAMREILRIPTAFSAYQSRCKDLMSSPNVSICRDIVKYMQDMLRVFGVIPADGQYVTSITNANVEHCVHLLSTLRDNLRPLAKMKKETKGERMAFAVGVKKVVDDYKARENEFDAMEKELKAKEEEFDAMKKELKAKEEEFKAKEEDDEAMKEKEMELKDARRFYETTLRLKAIGRILYDGVNKLKDQLFDDNHDVTGSVSFLIFNFCDRTRDYLIEAGILLADQISGPSIWKTDDPSIIRRDWKILKEKQVFGPLRKKVAAAQANAKKLKDKIDKFSAFAKLYDGYTFSADGMPIKDPEGNPLSDHNASLKKDYKACGNLYKEVKKAGFTTAHDYVRHLEGEKDSAVLMQSVLRAQLNKMERRWKLDRQSRTKLLVRTIDMLSRK
jgi:cysteinyl-tRNA synthetase